METACILRLSLLVYFWRCEWVFDYFCDMKRSINSFFFNFLNILAKAKTSEKPDPDSSWNLHWTNALLFNKFWAHTMSKLTLTQIRNNCFQSCLQTWSCWEKEHTWFAFSWRVVGNDYIRNRKLLRKCLSNECRSHWIYLQKMFTLQVL